MKLCGTSNSIFWAYAELGLKGVEPRSPSEPERLGLDFEISITPEPPEGRSRWRNFFSEFMVNENHFTFKSVL